MGEAVVEFRPAVDGNGVALEGRDGLDEGGVETITHGCEFSKGEMTAGAWKQVPPIWVGTAGLLEGEDRTARLFTSRIPCCGFRTDEEGLRRSSVEDEDRCGRLRRGFVTTRDTRNNL